MWNFGLWTEDGTIIVHDVQYAWVYDNMVVCLHMRGAGACTVDLHSLHFGGAGGNAQSSVTECL